MAIKGLADVPLPVFVFGLGQFDSGAEAEQAIIHDYIDKDALNPVYLVIVGNGRNSREDTRLAYVDLRCADDLVQAKEFDRKYGRSYKPEDLTVLLLTESSL